MSFRIGTGPEVTLRTLFRACAYWPAVTSKEVWDRRVLIVIVGLEDIFLEAGSNESIDGWASSQDSR